MSISRCCRAKVKYGERSGDEGPESIIICQGCGQTCGEFDPPCDSCGSDDPCSCSDFYDPYLEMPNEEETKNIQQPIIRIEIPTNIEKPQKIQIQKKIDNELNQAQIFFDEGKTLETIEAADRALELEPKNREFLFLKGRALDKSKKFTEAVGVYNEILANNPEDIDVLSEKYFSLLSSGMPPEQAQKTFLPIVQSCFTKGANFFAAGKFQEAIEKYDEILGWDPGNMDALYDEACALVELGKYPEAIRLFDEIVKENPLYKNAFNNRQKARDRLNKTQKIATVNTNHMNQENKLTPDDKEANTSNMPILYFYGGLFLLIAILAVISQATKPKPPPKDPTCHPSNATIYNITRDENGKQIGVTEETVFGTQCASGFYPFIDRYDH